MQKSIYYLRSFGAILSLSSLLSGEERRKVELNNERRGRAGRARDISESCGGTKEKEKTIRRTAKPEDEERWRGRAAEKDRVEIGTGGGVIMDCSP